jgi:DNA-binding NarL/FixJ family response regulator
VLVATRVLLVDPRTLFRQGFRSLLEGEGGFAVVGETGDARAACELWTRARPDVTVSELELDGLSGVALAEELARRHAGARLLFLTAAAQRHHVQRALSAGVHGYALKAQPFSDVAAAIRAVARGERYLAPGLAPFADGVGRRHKHGDDPCWQLSPREREVFFLLLRGFDNRYIASRLGVTTKTVETHRAHLFRKLEAHSVADLLRFAARHHLLPE